MGVRRGGNRSQASARLPACTMQCNNRVQLSQTRRTAHAHRYKSAHGVRVKRQAWCRAAAGQADTATVQPVPNSPPAVQTPNDAGKKDLSQVVLPVSDESDQLLRIRHSCAHLMAMAMQRMHRGTQVTIGPWTDNGFYYDFDMSNAAPFTEKVLKKVKKEMRRLMRKDLPFVKEEVTAEEARRRITELGEPYKLEILDSILERDASAPITIYHIGQPGDKEHWWDLCAGPHVASTGELTPEAVDLERTAGAYWRGDENRQMLTRIYGTAWESELQLEAYRFRQEEALKRDHRKLGQQLSLFSIQEAAGGGLVFWLPKGAMVRNILETFWKDIHLARGYDLMYTPHVAKVDLWKTSGHFEHYGENMFDQMQIEDESYQLRPMNCPFHVLAYKNAKYSYRDLPLRWAELGTVYRYERSGTMHGLFRVRGFTQDDAHIFCTPQQIMPEIEQLLCLVEDILGKFGFSQFEVNLSTRPEDSIGSDTVWNTAEGALRDALNSKGWQFSIDEGGGAFYGPKIDIKIQDSIGRKWQCSTIQLDFNLPERFEMEYTDSDNAKQRPIMIHRAIFGSVERFMGILIEDCKGAFPAWLAPMQCRVIPVTASCEESCQSLVDELKAAGCRAEMVVGLKMGKAIRNAQVDKIPLVCVIGPRDIESGAVSVRTYSEGEVGQLPRQELVSRLVNATQGRTQF